jgi:hypothetical protein
MGDRTYKVHSGITSEYGRYVKSLGSAVTGQRDAIDEALSWPQRQERCFPRFVRADHRRPVDPQDVERARTGRWGKVDPGLAQQARRTPEAICPVSLDSCAQRAVHDRDDH